MNEEPKLMTGDNHGRAIDRAIELLGIALRDEIGSDSNRRAELFKERLRNANRPVLREHLQATRRP